MNRAVIAALQKRAQEAGLKNFNFYKSIPTETGDHKDSNWSRARNIFDGGEGGLRWPGGGEIQPLEKADTPVDSVEIEIETPNPERVEAKTRAKAYADMSKIEMNAAYDALRKSDPAKAAVEGLKMHKAFFNK